MAPGKVWGVETQGVQDIGIAGARVYQVGLALSDSRFRVPKSLVFKGIERRVHGGFWRCLAHLTLSILKACLKSFAASGFT